MESPPIVHTMELHRRANAPRFFQRPIVLGIFTLSLAFVVGAVFAAQYAMGDAEGPKAVQMAAVVTAEDPFDGIQLDAKAAMVQDLATGKILFALNPDAQLPLASITKVPLALIVSEVMDAQDTIRIPRYTSAPGTNEHFDQGAVWKVRDVVDFTLVASSNTGAEVLAEAAESPIKSRYPQAPATDATLWRMNQLAKDLQLNNTYFLNATGLDVSATQAGAYSSARDVAKLFGYAARSWPAVFAGTTRDNLLLTSAEGSTARAYNTDEALGAIPGLIMGKTGYTDLAGGNLAIVFDVGIAHPVVVVVLGSTLDGRFEDIKKLVSATQRAIIQQ